METVYFHPEMCLCMHARALGRIKVDTSMTPFPYLFVSAYGLGVGTCLEALLNFCVWKNDWKWLWGLHLAIKSRSDHVSCRHKIFHWLSISRSQQTLGSMQWLIGSEFFFLFSHHQSNFCLLSSPTSSSHWVYIPHSVSTSTNMPRCSALLVPFLLNVPITSRSLFKHGLPWKSFLKLCLSLPTHPDPLSSSLFSLYHSLSTRLYFLT